MLTCVRASHPCIIMGALEAMTTPQAQVAKAFGKKKTLYEILGVAKDAASAVIRKAYFKMALTCVSKEATLANKRKIGFVFHTFERQLKARLKAYPILRKHRLDEGGDGDSKEKERQHRFT